MRKTETSLQKLDAGQRHAIWIERVAECRNSGKSVREWCREREIHEKTYYYWQKRIWDMSQQTRNPEFAELPALLPSTSRGIVATVQIGNVKTDIYTGADESTIQAIVQALKSC